MKNHLILIFSLFNVFGYAQTKIDPTLSPTTARINEAIQGSIATSGTDTYTGTLTGLTNASGKAYNVTFGNANTGSATFNLNASGAVTIRKFEGGALVNLVAGDISAGETKRLRYNGTYLVIEGGSGGGGGSGDFETMAGTPGAFSGNNLSYMRVSSGATQLEYRTPDGVASDLPAANTFTRGVLTATDWNTFNGKQSAITFGTGVQTALGVNTGSAGAPVLFNGALGTPSSGTATNLTGLPATGVTNTPSGSISSTNQQAVNNELDTEKLSASDLTTTRTVTTTGAIVQSDNLRIIYFNSASPFNFTIDALTINSQTTFINIGTATVTFVNGSGVTYTGSTSLTAGQTALIVYHSSTAPIIFAGSDVPTATSSTAGVAKLYTTTGTNTDGAVDQATINANYWKNTGTTTLGTPTVTQTATSSGATKFLTFTGAAHTNQTASTEVIDLDLDFSATMQHATGGYTTQRSMIIRPRTYSFVGSSTLTNGITLYLTPPVAGTNATITNRLSLHADGGVSQFGATIQSGYTGSLVATVNANNRIAMFGAFEFVNSGTPGYSGVGISLPAANRTLTYYGGSLTGTDLASSIWTSSSYNTARGGASLSNVNITMPSANASVFTATDYSLLKIDGTPPTLTTPLSAFYGMNINMAAAGNATKNVAIVTNANAGNVEFGANVVLPNVGSGIIIKEGTNATMGIATLVAGTVVVSTTKVTANSRIMLTRQNLGTITVPVGLAVSARSAGTSFTILSGDLTDTSAIAWQIIEPAP